MREIWFWQRIVTPHMSAIAVALARIGCRIRYVAEQPMSADRLALGWRAPDLPGVALDFVQTREQVRDLIKLAPNHAIHLVQGFYRNGLIGVALKRLRENRAHYWVVVETIDLRGLLAWVKRLVYRGLVVLNRERMQGVLAIGSSTPLWLVGCGAEASRVFPFAYFLSGANNSQAPAKLNASSGPLRFCFAGQLIERKRLDLLLSALSMLRDRGYDGYELVVIGDGPQRVSLEAQAAAALGDRVQWSGVLPMDAVRAELRYADCLVLPSDHDGWGAVVSEALMVGTPVICSDACGSSVAVKASGKGGVFPAGDAAALEALLMDAIKLGKRDPVEREQLAVWAECLGAEAGAHYLLEILDHRCGFLSRPLPPWARS